MRADHEQTLPRAALYLGLSGLLPAAACCLATAFVADLRWIAPAAGFAYAALIFSFVGGIWWGVGLFHRPAPRWLWFAAVLPSLIGLALFMPWTIGWEWPGPSLIALGLLLLASPVVDRGLRSLAPLPEGWITLRTLLSNGLGLLTILLGLVHGV